MEEKRPIALFGETEKGKFNCAYFINSLGQLVDFFGHPPPESQGIHFAVQALLYDRNVIYFRVKEEGFSYQDYFLGLKLLEKKDPEFHLSAICLPGVGDRGIIDQAIPLCHLHKSILITTEPDLYDYLTEASKSGEEKPSDSD